MKLHNQLSKLLNILLAAIGCGWFAGGSVSGATPEFNQPVARTPSPKLTEQPQKGDFQLVGPEAIADLCMNKEDFKVVQLATECFAVDVERVTGKKPRVKTESRELSRQAVFIGTIGKSVFIDGLIAADKLDVKSIAGNWESFIIATVSNPLPGVDTGLVIAGSDRRGTAYGVFTLSEAIGVSPWVWWADVPPQRREVLTLSARNVTSHAPSVKYRGIFINDEDWGLQPWSAKTFEPEVGDIGPKTYAKVCELLLRLKANYLWPAMHPCTKAFNHYSANKQVADDYAIVMGSSHCEQMLRNNVDEYDVKTRGPWDYERNRDNILTYWRQRLEENGKLESLYTIGMRGIHDGGMPGGGNTAQKVARLQRVIEDQRELIAETVNPDPTKVPQIFCPYKEVLTLYQNGLKVPEDVTLVWPDDNHGYIRQLSNPEEQKRSGGSGVYYHISYWGAPEDYLWLDTTPPALMWEEMRKAYDHGARAVWVVNVGDIKPAEIGMEFFLRMAWDMESWDETAQLTFLTDWAGRNFGEPNAGSIAAILDEYYRLNYAAKPEHIHRAQFTANYNETGERLQRFAKLVEQTNAVYDRLPQEQRDAFFETVVYPVRGSALVNEMHLSNSFEKAQQAYNQIQTETKHYNEQVAYGKWRHLMSSNPRNRPALQRPKPTANPASITTSNEDESATGSYVSIEAEHATRTVASDGTAWKTIPGLGRSGDSIALRPTTAAIPDQAALEYDFTVKKAGNVTVQVYCIPTHPIHRKMKLRYAVSLDSGEAQIIDIATSEFSKSWSTNVLRASAIGTTEHVLADPGKHTLHIRPLDPGLIFDKVVIDLGGLKPSHLGPPETPKTRSTN